MYIHTRVHEKPAGLMVKKNYRNRTSSVEIIAVRRQHRETDKKNNSIHSTNKLLRRQFIVVDTIRALVVKKKK